MSNTSSDEDETKYKLRRRKSIIYSETIRRKTKSKEVKSSDSDDSINDNKLFQSLMDIYKTTEEYKQISIDKLKSQTDLSEISTSDTSLLDNTLTSKFKGIIQIPFSNISSNKIIKMATSLSEIVKFTKLVGSYDADLPDASIRSHLTRLELYADI